MLEIDAVKNQETLMLNSREKFTFIWHPADRNKEKHLSKTDAFALFYAQTQQIKDIMASLPENAFEPIDLEAHSDLFEEIELITPEPIPVPENGPVPLIEAIRTPEQISNRSSKLWFKRTCSTSSTANPQIHPRGMHLS